MFASKAHDALDLICFYIEALGNVDYMQVHIHMFHNEKVIIK